MKFLVFMGLVGLSLSSCLSVGGAESDGLRRLGYEDRPGALHELEVALLRPDLEAQKVIRDWRVWLGEDGYPIRQDSRVTFVFFDPNRPHARIGLSGDFNAWRRDEWLLESKTIKGLYFLTLERPSWSRSEYQFAVWQGEHFQMQRDSLNPDRSFQDRQRSLLAGDQDPEGRIRLLDVLAYKPGSEVQGRAPQVYLPAEYFRNPEQRFSVLYLNDGQNLWDSPHSPWGGWKVDSIVDRLVAQGKMAPVIVVGVPNSGLRGPEYVGASSYFGLPQERGDTAKRYRALASDYLDYLLTVVKPAIDKDFRTLTDAQHTAIGGSSFGAGQALWAGLSHPEVFGKVLAMSAGNYSPELTPDQWPEKPFAVMPFLIATSLERANQLKIYLDCGGRDLDGVFVQAARPFHEELIGRGLVEGKNLMWVEDPNGSHNEMAWAARLPQALPFLFPPSL